MRVKVGALEPLGDRALGEARARELSDVLGHVAHALERGAHSEGGDHDAQVAGDGLLAGEDLDRELVELEGLLVDDGVGLDDLFGERDVARAERAGGAVDRDGHEVGDLDQSALNVLEGLVEYFAHGRVPSSSAARHGVSRNPRDSSQRRLTSGAVTVNSSLCCDSHGGERPVTVEGRPYAGGMEQPQLVLLALLAGLLIGAAVVGLVVAALRARDRSLAQTSAEVPEGVEAMLGAMDDPAFVCDTSSTVLALSPAAEVFGAHAGEVISSEELKRVARVARDTGSGIAENLRLRRGAAPAEPRLVAVRATPISGRLTLVVLRDITERERVEEMRRDFVANTSHELKTPVGAVSLLSEAIEFAADDPAQVRHFASRLQAEVTRLAALVNRILSLSRLQASDELRDVRDVSIDEVVTAAVEGYAIQADAAQVTVRPRRHQGCCGARRLTEAVGNLVANAIAYSPEGSKVGVGVKLDDTVVEIAVTDRGIGIPESDQHRVFERFYRADQARSRRTGGTGLGLSIVKHAVQRHGGEVRLWSRPDRGSTFTIRLPMSEAPDLEGVRPKTPSQGPQELRDDPVPAKGDTA